MSASNLIPDQISEEPENSENSESENDSEITPTTRSKRSWVWEHGTRLEINDKSFWKCNYCMISL